MLQFICSDIPLQQFNQSRRKLRQATQGSGLLLLHTQTRKRLSNLIQNTWIIFRQAFFFVLNQIMARVKKTITESTKLMLLEAFDKSETKSIKDACRIVGVTLNAYYFHFYKDSSFRTEVCKKRRDQKITQTKKL